MHKYLEIYNETKKYTMMLLAVFPVLHIYATPFVLSWGEFFFVLLMIASVLKKEVALFRYPHRYMWLWGYVAVTYVLLSLFRFRLGVLIPGGYSFFLYSLMLGYSIAHFDLKLLKKYYRIVFFIAFSILLLQEFTANVMGFRFAAIIPFGTLTDGFPTADLIHEHLNPNDERSSSIFREPAHFAQFVLPLLAIELFCDKKNRLIPKMALIIILSLVILRSGNGFVGLIVLLTIRLGHYLIKEKVKNKVMIVIATLLMGGWALSYYIASKEGSEILERTEEIENDEDAASYIRIYRGYRLYEDMPLSNKLIGATDDDLLSLIPKSSVSFLFKGEKQSDLYFNGIQTILLYNGLVGLFFWLIIYIGIYRKTSIIGKSLLWLLLIISAIGATYVSFFMLITTCISESEKRKKNEENRILYKA